MTPKIEWCNWVFDYTDNMDANRWMVKRDCCDDEILLIREIKLNHHFTLI